MSDTNTRERWGERPPSAGPAARELAAAEALLGEVAADGRPLLRWYAAAAPALVLGSGQRLSDVDPEALARARVPLHRRASGGTAVLFVPGFVMQDIALPPGHPLQVTDVSESYRWLGEIWALALAGLGLAAEPIGVAEAHADRAAAEPLVARACFGGRSPYELLAGGRKLVGFSQVRRRHGTLFQVGVYTDWPGAALAGLLDLPDAGRAELARRLAARVVGLAELTVGPPGLAELRGAFAAALARRHGAASAEEPWSAEGLAAIQAGATGRYAPIDPAATPRPLSSS